VFHYLSSLHLHIEPSPRAPTEKGRKTFPQQTTLIHYFGKFICNFAFDLSAYLDFFSKQLSLMFKYYQNVCLNKEGKKPIHIFNHISNLLHDVY